MEGKYLLKEYDLSEDDHRAQRRAHVTLLLLRIPRISCLTCGMLLWIAHIKPRLSDTKAMVSSTTAR